MKKVLFGSAIMAAFFAGCGGDSNCCSVDESLSPTADNTPPVAVITGLEDGTTVEVGQSVSANGGTSTDRDGTVTSYTWTVNGTATSTDTNPTFTFDTAGDHEVCLTVTDNDNLNSANVECRTVTVTSVAPSPTLPTAIITLTDSDAPLQVFTNHTFSCADSHDNDTLGTGAEIVRCDWDIQSYLADGVTPYRDCSAENTVSYEVTICTQVGKIVAKLTVTDNDGQQASTTTEYTEFSR